MSTAATVSRWSKESMWVTLPAEREHSTSRTGTVTDQSIGYVGALPGASGVINVSNAGSSFTNAGTLYFGDYGSAQMTISGGASVRTSTTYMAFQPGSVCNG